MIKTISRLLLLLIISILGMSQVTFAETYPEFCSVFNRNLQQGSIGQDVKRLQVVLGQEGISYLPSTGYYGPATSAAVKTFQIRNGIYPAGKVGPQTFRYMRNLWCFGYVGGGPVNPIPPLVNSGNAEVSIQPVSSNANNVTVSWNSQNVNACTLQKDIESVLSVPNQGQRVFTLYGESRFTIICLDFNGREYIKQIVVRPNQTISNLPWVNVSISPTQVLIGQQATLYWTSQNTSYCTSNVPGYNSNLQTSGSIPVSITSNYNSFTFTCYNQGGQSVSQTITTTSNTSALPVINNFTYSNNYLAWGTSNTNSCVISGGNLSNQSVSTNANLYVATPNVNTTWTLTCYGNNGQSATRQVNNSTTSTGSLNNLFSVTVTTDKSSYNVGESVTFTINVRNNTTSNLTYNEPICDPFYSFMINGTSVFSTPQAQCLAYGTSVVTLTPGQTKTYTLTVPAGYSNITNSSGNKTINFRFYPTSTMGTIDIYQNIGLNVSGTQTGNLTASIYANPSNTTYTGQPVTLTWSSTNATYCNITGGNTNLINQPTSGSTTVYPTVNSSYYATCYNSSNQSIQSNVAYVTVVGGNTGAVTVNISASPNPMGQGQLTNLTWYSSNANYCNIIGGNTNLANQPVNGSYAVSPAQSTNYTITCYNNNGQNASAYVYVTINGNTTTNSNTSLFITSNQNRNVNINVYKAPYNTCNSGYINWGYNTSNTYYTYPNVTSGSACQIGVTHTYANPGTYTITAYENNVQVASTQITVQ